MEEYKKRIEECKKCTMTEEEYRNKMKKYGWSYEDIEEYIELYNFALKIGLPVTLEKHLQKPPKIYTDSFSED